jgi:hypothetical protein
MDKQLSIEEMVERFPGTSKSSWAGLRFAGTGPRFTKVGKKVFYPESAVIEFLEKSTRVQSGAAA